MPKNNKVKLYVYIWDTTSFNMFRDSKKNRPNDGFCFFKTLEQAMKHYFDTQFCDWRDENDDDAEMYYLNGANPEDVKKFYEATNGKRYVIETYFGVS